MRSSVDIQFSVCLRWIIPEPSFPSQGSQARGTRLRRYERNFNISEGNFSSNLSKSGKNKNFSIFNSGSTVQICCQSIVSDFYLITLNVTNDRY